MEKIILPEEAALINKVAAKYGYEPVEPKELDEGPDCVAWEMTYTVGEKWDAIDINVVRMFQDGFDPTWVVCLADCCGSVNNWIDDEFNEDSVEREFKYFVETYIAVEEEYEEDEEEY